MAREGTGVTLFPCHSEQREDLQFAGGEMQIPPFGRNDKKRKALDA